MISNDQCTRSYGPSVVLPSTLCTLGWENNSQSTCNGDSGGPLLIDEVIYIIERIFIENDECFI